jgi:hypothetical protein
MYLDELCVTMERSGATAKAREAELLSAVDSHAKLQAQHAELARRASALHARVKQLEMEVHNERRGANLARQAVTDKERQLVTLLAEVERLHGRQVRGRAGGLCGCVCSWGERRTALPARSVALRCACGV